MYLFFAECQVANHRLRVWAQETREKYFINYFTVYIFENILLKTYPALARFNPNMIIKNNIIKTYITPRTAEPGALGGLSPPLFTKITFYFVLVWGTYEEIKKKQKKTKKNYYVGDMSDAIRVPLLHWTTDS